MSQSNTQPQNQYGAYGSKLPQQEMNLQSGQTSLTSGTRSNTSNLGSQPGVSSQYGQNLGGQYTGTERSQQFSSQPNAGEFSQKNFSDMQRQGVSDLQGQQYQSRDISGSYGSQIPQGNVKLIQGQTGLSSNPSSHISSGLGSQPGLGGQFSGTQGGQHFIPQQGLTVLQGEQVLSEIHGQQRPSSFQGQELGGLQGQQGLSGLQGQQGLGGLQSQQGLSSQQGLGSQQGLSGQQRLGNQQGLGGLQSQQGLSSQQGPIRQPGLMGLQGLSGVQAQQAMYQQEMNSAHTGESGQIPQELNSMQGQTGQSNFSGSNMRNLESQPRVGSQFGQNIGGQQFNQQPGLTGYHGDA